MQISCTENLGIRGRLYGLLVAQAFYGIELGGAGGWDGAENYADHRRHDDSDDGGQAGDRDAVLGKEANGVGDGEADDDAGEASDERNEDSLGQKLKADFAVGCADGFADADLADAGGHGGSIMFMIPMPLTTSVTIEISNNTQVRPVAIRSAMASSAVRLATS